MKFSCDTCHARYAIADEKVRGKILRVRCKKCGSSIVLKEPEEEAVVEPAPVREDDATHVVRSEEIRRGLGTPETGTSPASKFVSRHSLMTEPGPPPPPKEKPEWYVLIQKEEVGPLRMDELRERATEGKLTPRTYVWRDGMANWARLQTVIELSGLLDLIPAAQQKPTAPPPPRPPASEIVPAGSPAPTEPPPREVAAPAEAAAPEVLSEPVEKTAPDPVPEPMVTAPPVDPSTLQTEVPTPSQERTVPMVDWAPVVDEPPPPTQPPAEEEPPPEEEVAPPLFGLNKTPVPVLAEAFASPATQSAEAPVPLAIPTETAPEGLAHLPSVLVNLDLGGEGAPVSPTPIELPKAPAPRTSAAGIWTLQQSGKADEKEAPPERSTSFIRALQPSPWKRWGPVIGLAALVLAFGVAYLTVGREPPPAPPAPVTPPPPPPEPPKVVKEKPRAAPKQSAPAAPASPPKEAARKPKTDEEAAFLAVQSDNPGHRLELKPADLIHHEEQDLNGPGGGSDIDADLLARKVKQVQPAIQQCMDAEKRHNPDLNVGKLVVTLAIAPSGSVSDVTFDKRNVSDANLGDCLRTAFKNIRMPPHEGEAQHAEIPLKLN